MEGASNPNLLHCTVERVELVNVCETCPEVPYIQIEVPDNARRIRQITFTITSRDQGWADHNNEQDPYHDSFTWFAVYVKKKALRHNAVTHQQLVQWNRRANNEFKTHEVCWKDENPDSDEALWLARLQKGDWIQLIPRAEYRAWVNIVENATMHLHYDEDIPEPELLRTDSVAAEGFEYRPLSLVMREIRLLLVHPGSFNEPIRCSLVHATLRGSTTQRFEALSYTWGEFARRSTIIVEYGGIEFTFPVTDSVEAALRHLRHDNDDVRTVFIDAICINQADYDERAQQISLMTEIYSAADQVDIWLGWKSEAEQTAFRVIRDIFNSMKNICPGGADCVCKGTKHLCTLERHKQMEKQAEEGRQDESGRRTLQLEIIRHQHQHRFGKDTPVHMRSYSTLLSELFRNPWFRRVWVLQEVINSRKAILYCGLESMPWEELLQIDSIPNVSGALHLLPLHTLPLIWTQLGRMWNPTLFPAPQEGTKRKDADTQTLDILDVFLQALNMDASDRRDKVFALLSFGEQTKSLHELPDLIRPNYNKSPQRVLADFTRWWIITNQSLDILSALHGQCGRTWAGLDTPGARVTSISRPTWAIGTEGRLKWAKTTLAAIFDWHAAGDTRIDFSLITGELIGRNPMRLRLRGLKVARIIEISHFPLGHEAQKTNSQLFSVYERIFDPTGRREIWKRGGILEGDEIDPTAEMWRIRAHLQDHWGYGDRPQMTIIHKSSEETGEGDPKVYHLHKTQWSLPCHGKCFFMANDGSAGLCPANARVDDVVVIFNGGKVPFLLRRMDAVKEEEVFEVVGECYVEGKMDGEAFGALGSIDSEIFNLV